MFRRYVQYTCVLQTKTIIRIMGSDGAAGPSVGATELEAPGGLREAPPPGPQRGP